MKKLFFSIAIMLLGFVAVAQNNDTPTPEGNGGDSPETVDNYWSIHGNDVSEVRKHCLGTTSLDPLRIKTNDTVRMFIDPHGLVGIGTIEPFQMLHVVGGNIMISKSADRAPGSTNGSLMFGGDITNSNQHGNYAIEYVNSETEGYGLNFWKPHTGNTNLKNNVLFLSDNYGRVGIGTNDPKAKLSVNGQILAKSVKVSTDAIYWPDFVFAPEYNKMSLNELETYINANHHLPGVPSAADVEEQEGVVLEEMNAILLQKVEELTLYIIELQKQIDKLKGNAKNDKYGKNLFY